MTIGSPVSVQGPGRSSTASRDASPFRADSAGDNQRCVSRHQQLPDSGQRRGLPVPSRHIASAAISGPRRFGILRGPRGCHQPAIRGIACRCGFGDNRYFSSRHDNRCCLLVVMCDSSSRTRTIDHHTRLSACPPQIGTPRRPRPIGESATTGCYWTRPARTPTICARAASPSLDTSMPKTLPISAKSLGPSR